MKDSAQIIAEILPALSGLEPDRQRYRKKSAIYLTVLFVPLAGLVTTALIVQTSSVLVFASIGWLVVGIVLYQLRAGRLAGQYRRNYKQKVVPALLTTIDPQLSYHAADGIRSTLFVASELFQTTPDRYTTEDLIRGKYGATELSLAEVVAKKRQTTTDSKGRTKTRYYTYFSGLFLIADFHKHFHGRTFVFPDKSEKTFGGLARFFQQVGGRKETDLIQMEDPEFEHDFKVYSTDRVEARYILSTAMMRRILDMKNRFGKDVRLAFKDSSLILAVPHKRAFLEPKTKLPADDPTQVEGMLEDLRFFLETIEELDLNTRIWTKE